MIRYLTTENTEAHRDYLMYQCVMYQCDNTSLIFISTLKTSVCLCDLCGEKTFNF